MKKIYLLIVAIFLTLNAKEVSGEFVKSYEEWSLPFNETMGVSKMGLTFNFTPYWFGGINLFASSKGKRGGFFTFGYESGLQTNPKNLLQLRSSIFVGAGGGGAAPQGGGLMIRGALEARANFKHFSLGGGISRVVFPNGDIKSTQAFGSLYIPFTLQKDSNQTFYLKEFILKNYIYLKGGKYFVKEGVLDTSGKAQKDLTLIGIDVQGFITDTIFTNFALYGANGGNADGYMEVFGGFGIKKALFNLPLYLSAVAELGYGGGGRVDTGGGAMYRVRGGIEANLYSNLVAGIEGGYVKSFKGSFSAKYLGAFLGFKSYFGDYKNLYDSYAIRALTKVHLSSIGDFKDNKKDEKIYLEGLAIDKYLNKNFYLTGQSLWAFKGKSGGYTEGLLGVGYKSETYNNLSFRAEALIGAGGGGGVKTGGLIGSFVTTINYNINKNITLSIGGGYTKAKEGLSSADIILGLGYKFNVSSSKNVKNMF